jgi:hypothetical protein
MEIKTLNPGKCCLTLDASRIIWETQQTDFPPDATTTFSGLPTIGLFCKLSLGKTIHLISWGPHKLPNSS